jgi:hypothetical protein
MPKIKSPDLITHLQQGLKARQEEKAKMQRLVGKASSLGLHLSVETVGDGPNEVVRYALADRQTKKYLTGPDGRIAHLATLEDVEVVLMGTKDG